MPITMDLTPLYRSLARNSIGFDQFASSLNSTLSSNYSSSSYPAYNIRSLAKNRYEITLAAVNYKASQLNIQVYEQILTVEGYTDKYKDDDSYIHKGIATQPFKRKFYLACYVEVLGAKLQDGLLTISLIKNVHSFDKPKNIHID